MVSLSLGNPVLPLADRLEGEPEFFGELFLGQPGPAAEEGEVLLEDGGDVFHRVTSFLAYCRDAAVLLISLFFLCLLDMLFFLLQNSWNRVFRNHILVLAVCENDSLGHHT